MPSTNSLMDKPLTEEQSELAGTNINLAREIAWRYQRSTDIEYSLLESAAFEGLCQAAARFDPERLSERTGKTMKFSSLAVPYIRGSILHYIRDRTYSMRLSHRMRELWVKGRKLVGEGRSDKAIAEALGIAVEEWQDVVSACSGPPLDLKDHAVPTQPLEPEEDTDLSSYREEAESVLSLMSPVLRREFSRYCTGRLREPGRALFFRFQKEIVSRLYAGQPVHGTASPRCAPDSDTSD